MRGEYEKAAELFRQGAHEGDVEAAFSYGYCLLYGIGVPCNYSEAKSYFAFARDLEGGEAAYNLAIMYMHGLGVSRNYKRSFQYMEAAAAKGCIEAELYLGMAYTTGCWFEPDVVSISIIPFHKPDYRIGTENMLMGEVPDAELDEELRFSVISANEQLAFLYFQAAARHDRTYVADLVAKGQFLYAKCYLDGMGTDFDRVKGTRLMLVAGKNGSSEAVGYLMENGINITPYLKDGGTK